MVLVFANGFEEVCQDNATLIRGLHTHYQTRTYGQHTFSFCDRWCPNRDRQLLSINLERLIIS